MDWALFAFLICIQWVAKVGVNGRGMLQYRNESRDLHRDQIVENGPRLVLSKLGTDRGSGVKYSS